MATRRQLRLLVTATAVLVAMGVPIGASADPTPSLREARREVARLEVEVDEAVEDFNESKVRLAAARRQAGAARGRVTREKDSLRRMQGVLGQLATSAYRSGGADHLVLLVNSTKPGAFLDRMSALDTLARSQAEQLRQVRAAHRRLSAQQAGADATLAAERALTTRLRESRRAIERKLARHQALLDLLESRAQRAARLARDRQRADLARASRARMRAMDLGSTSGRARIAVSEAYRQLGKPYQWGADGPDRFDCSGLTMWVWAKAGVSLPHSSRAQFNEGFHVSREALRPGDLVFFGSPIHHVGIYVGNHQYIAAPRTGDVVSVRSMSRGGYAGAVRL